MGGDGSVEALRGEDGVAFGGGDGGGRGVAGGELVVSGAGAKTG